MSVRGGGGCWFVYRGEREPVAGGAGRRGGRVKGYLGRCRCVRVSTRVEWGIGGGGGVGREERVHTEFR